jgi:hypothetical protein
MTIVHLNIGCCTMDSLSQPRLQVLCEMYSKLFSYSSLLNETDADGEGDDEGATEQG